VTEHDEENPMGENGRQSDGDALDPVGQLIAIEAIRNLKAQYWRFVDTKQWVAFGRLFAPDATFTDHSGGPFHCEGAAEIESKIMAVLHDAVSVHHGHQSEIEIEDGSHARAIWVMEDYLIFPPGTSHATNPFPDAVVHGYGHYVEEYVKIDGDWRFQKVDLYRLRVEILSPMSTPYPAEFLVDQAVRT
jgi:hypothetical protein